MKISQIVESATTAGSIATVESPLGTTQSRTQKPPKSPKVVKGRKFANTISEGKMKEIAYDLQHMDAGNFKKKYGKTKEEVKASLKEEKIAEADLIVVPGMRRMKDKSFTPHEKDRRDHEVEMARSELHAAAKDAMRIFKLLKDRSEDDGIMGWQQSYITLASDYLNSVADSLEYQMNMYEMTAGVIAGGMSNFEESKDKTSLDAEKLEKLKKLLYRNRSNTREFGPKASLTPQELDLLKKEINRLTTKANVSGTNEMKGRYYNPLDQERREQAAMDADRRRFKWDELSQELAGEEEAARRANEGPWYILINGKLVRDKSKNPYTFNTLSAAQKAVKTMSEKAWNKDKKFVYTRTPKDSDVSEGKSHKCPECGGEMVSEELMNEKKDACYYKVKSRYKVWPSAYASGALVKCRKKGASNWGNKSKK